jgi:hypothetical protein
MWGSQIAVKYGLPIPSPSRAIMAVLHDEFGRLSYGERVPGLCS